MFKRNLKSGTKEGLMESKLFSKKLKPDIENRIVFPAIIPNLINLCAQRRGHDKQI